MKYSGVLSLVILSLKAMIANNIHNVMNNIIIDIIGRITFHFVYEIFFSIKTLSTDASWTL